MKKILIYVHGLNGCTLHRLILPYSTISKELFEVQLGTDKKDDELFDYIKDFDIFVFHRLLPDGMLERIKKDCPNTTVICDIDDYWVLSSSHILYNQYRQWNISERVFHHIQLSDYVTTTTDALADKIKPINPNVHVFPNALIPDGEFEPHPTQSDKIRFGIIGGSTHFKEITDNLGGIMTMLPTDVLEKVQFVLCGFDKGVLQVPQSDGSLKEELMPWEQNGWTITERALTSNYKFLSSEHVNFLNTFQQGMNYTTEEPYRRVWTRDVWNYATFYDEIDCLLVPLIDSEFNRNKSELKLIEASVKNKPAIVSDVYPYKICGINVFDKGGEINPDGNCIMVNDRKGVRAWVKAITRFVRDKYVRDLITDNLHKLTTGSGAYNLMNVSEKRNQFLSTL